MKSFRNPQTNILTCYGYVDSNGTDTSRDEPEGFSLEPGKWQLVNNQWVPYSPSTVPQQVTMRQARLALFHAGLLDKVNAAVAGMTGPAGTAAQIEWEFSSTVERNRPLVQALGGILGLTPLQLDGLFATAAGL